MSLPTNLTVARRSAQTRDIAGFALAAWYFVKQAIRDFSDLHNVGWVKADYVMLILAEVVLTAIFIEFIALFFAARSARKADEAADES